MSNRLDNDLDLLVKSGGDVGGLKGAGLRFEEDLVQVVAVVASGEPVDGVIRWLEANGARHVISAENLVQSFVDWRLLPALSQLPQVVWVRKPLYVDLPPPSDTEPVANKTLFVTSEGLAAMNADAWQAAGHRGSGVSVAVIDGGFQGALALIGTELPSSGVYTQTFGGIQFDGSLHGTACAEIIFDIAPDLESLYLFAIGTEVDVANAVNAARSLGVDVISMSLGALYWGPGDGTGIIATALNSFVSAGGVAVVSAGNQRLVHWQGQWVDSDSDGLLNFADGFNVNFITDGESLQFLPFGTSFNVQLVWNQWVTPHTDLALKLVYWDGVNTPQVVYTANQAQSGQLGQLPVEKFPYTVLLPGYYGIAVAHTSGPTDIDLEFITRLLDPHPLEFNIQPGSVTVPGDTASAISVAALDALPPFSLEPYSSKGPTNGPGGSIAGGRTTPDVSGFANVSTVSYGYQGFNGTSAACPHVSGAAALVWSANPAWTNQQVRSFLESNALDMGPVGKDNDFGYGRLWLGDPPAGCSYSISPTSRDHGAAGGAGSVAVSTADGCSWTAASNNPTWLTITSGSSGTGAGGVSYSVAQNTTANSRTGTLTIAGKTFTVTQSGLSCDKDGPPTASFIIEPSPALEGEEVTFTDTSGGSLKVFATGFYWTPTSPEIGELVHFTITGHTGDVRAEWDFGENGCSGFPQIQVCEPLYGDCIDWTFKFASGGDKTVSVTVKNPNTGAVLGSTVRTITVQNAGGCDGPPTCTYSLNPPNWPFPAEGGTTTFSVNTQTGCNWNATTANTWITLTGATSGTGSGSVSYAVAANTGPARSGAVFVENQTHSVTQVEGGGGGGGGDTTPTEWLWTIRRGSQVVTTSSQPSFTYAFTDPGFYEVELVASNCAGADTATQILEIIDVPDPQSDTFVVPSAVHSPGLNQTLWKTDLRIFNPGDQTVDVKIEYLPENTNNTQGVIHSTRVALGAKQTRAFDDVVLQIPGVHGDNNKGSLRVSIDGGSAETLVLMSRTYNDTPDGTFGQFVPAVYLGSEENDTVFFSGLAENDRYRTNFGLANLESSLANNIDITLYDEDGGQLGYTFGTGVLPSSTAQIVRIARFAGISEDLDTFSIKVELNGNRVATYASVVDNVTGDPVYHSPGSSGASKCSVPGVAHLPGLNNSTWRSDITFFNPGQQQLDASYRYYPDGYVGWVAPHPVSLGPKEAVSIIDVIGEISHPGGDNSKGHIVVAGQGGGIAPLTVARTYNLNPASGTFGQNVSAFDDAMLLEEGHSGYLPGVCNSADPATGSRTNIGIANASSGGMIAQALITFWSDGGTIVASSKRVHLAADEMYQANLFDLLELSDYDLCGTARVLVETGGPVAAYASIIDNRTQDPIMVPAVR